MDARNLFEHTANALQVFGYVKTISYNIELKFLQFRNHHKNQISLVQKAPKTVLVIVLLCLKIDMLTKNLFIKCYSSGLAASNDILIISNKCFPAKLLQIFHQPD
jgi:hypothetical protein